MADTVVPAEVRDKHTSPFHRGSNQSGMRANNERLVLSLVRRHGGLAKTEIARITGLSAQTVSVIMRSLEADQLLARGAPVRGRVGQPSVPLSLNPPELPLRARGPMAVAMMFPEPEKGGRGKKDLHNDVAGFQRNLISQARTLLRITPAPC